MLEIAAIARNQRGVTHDPTRRHPQNVRETSDFLPPLFIQQRFSLLREGKKLYLAEGVERFLEQ